MFILYLGFYCKIMTESTQVYNIYGYPNSFASSHRALSVLQNHPDPDVQKMGLLIGEHFMEKFLIFMKRYHGTPFSNETWDDHRTEFIAHYISDLPVTIAITISFWDPEHLSKALKVLVVHTD